MPRLVNTLTGASAEFPTWEEREAAVASGRWVDPEAVQPPDEATLVAPGGHVFRVPRSEIGNLPGHAAEREAAPEEVAQVFEQQEKQSEAENAYGQLGTAALGIGRTVSYGLSDVVSHALAPAVGSATWSEQQDLKQAFPITNFLSETAGFFVPGSVGNTIGKGLTKAGVTGLAKVGALEAGLYGLASGFTEAAIDDKPFTAETLGAIALETGAQALGGAVIGGGLDVLGKAVSRLKPKIPIDEAIELVEGGTTRSVKLRDILTEELAKVDPTNLESGIGVVQQQNRAAARALEKQGELLEYKYRGGQETEHIQDLRFGHEKEIARLEAKAQHIDDKIAGFPQEYFQNPEKLAEIKSAQKAARLFRAEAAEIRRAEADILQGPKSTQVGGKRARGPRGNSDFKELQDQIVNYARSEAAYEAIEKSWARLAPQLQNLDEIPKLGRTAVRRLINDVENHMAEVAVYRGLMNKQVVSDAAYLVPHDTPIDEILGRMAQAVHGKPEITSLPIDDIIRATGYTGATKNILGHLGPEMLPTSPLGKAILGNWALHQSSRIMKTLEAGEATLKTATDKVSKNILKDAIKGGYAVYGKAKFLKNVGQAASGNPVAQLKLLNWALTNGRKHLQTAAKIIEGVGKYGVKPLSRPAIDRLVSPGRPSEKYKTPKTSGIMKKAEEVVARATDPQLDYKLQKKYANMFMVVPEVAAQAMATEKKLLTSLAQAAPQERSSVSLGKTRWYPSMDQLHSFAEQYAWAVAPLERFNEKFSAGKLTPEDTSFLKEHFPDIYSKLIQGIIDNQETLKKNTKYEDRLQLAILTGMPADEVLEPAFMATLQANFANAPEAQPNQAIPANKTLPTAEPTQAQKYSEA